MPLARPFARPTRRRSTAPIGSLSGLLAVTAALVACGSKPNIQPPTIREIGLIPNAPNTSGRDVGFSARIHGHDAWIFGDTFFAQPDANGYQWRSSTWAYTDDTDAGDGLDGWTQALGADGKPLQLLPHTTDEQAFNDAHNGNPCQAGSDCGARHTPWPGSMVVDPRSGDRLIFYELEYTELGSSFHAVGSSIAVWSDVTAPARRPVVRPGTTHPTLLFGAAEPTWDDAALVDGDDVYVYACTGPAASAGCLIARAPVDAALRRDAWRFYTGSAWVADWTSAKPIFSGAPLMSVHYSPYLGQFVALYMVPLTSTMALRTAPRPQGPWSGEMRFAAAEPPPHAADWDYGLLAHPELARGAREYLSYFRPGTFLDGTIHLVELTYQ